MPELRPLLALTARGIGGGDHSEPCALRPRVGVAWQLLPFRVRLNSRHSRDETSAPSASGAPASGPKEDDPWAF